MSREIPSFCREVSPSPQREMCECRQPRQAIWLATSRAEGLGIRAQMDKIQEEGVRWSEQAEEVQNQPRSHSPASDASSVSSSRRTGSTGRFVVEDGSSTPLQPSSPPPRHLNRPPHPSALNHLPSDSRFTSPRGNWRLLQQQHHPINLHPCTYLSHAPHLTPNDSPPNSRVSPGSVTPPLMLKLRRRVPKGRFCWGEGFCCTTRVSSVLGRWW